MRHLKTAAVATVLALVVLVCADYTAFAATGRSLVLGKVNTASATTAVARTTAGPVLTVTAKSPSNPPLRTNARGRVANLNADLLDGLDSTTLLGRTYVRTGTSGAPINEFDLALPVPAGRYLVTYAAPLTFTDTNEHEARCELTVSKQGPVLAFATGTFSGSPIGAAVNGSGVVTVPAGKTVTLTCVIGGGMFTVDPATPVQIAATRIARSTDLAPVDLAP